MHGNRERNLRMDTIVIACKTLEKELALAMHRTQTAYPVEWIESGLHERPKKLAETVQERLDGLCAGRVLLCLGQCGNSMVGIRAGEYELVMPKVDDCLSLILGSCAVKSRLGANDKAFFLTEGWLSGESTITSQYARSVEKYGAETALSILKMLYGHYETLGLVDTGVCAPETLVAQTDAVAELLGLRRRLYPGTTAYIEALLTGPWPVERFLVKAPFAEIKAEDFDHMV